MQDAQQQQGFMKNLLASLSSFGQNQTQQIGQSPSSLGGLSLDDNGLGSLGGDNEIDGGLFGDLGGLDKFEGFAKGLASLGQVYGAIKGVGLAKDQLAFSKQSYATNLANQTQTYNTSLDDKIRNRYNTEGKTSGQADAYLEKHSL